MSRQPAESPSTSAKIAASKTVGARTKPSAPLDRIWEHLAISVALGLLVGLQREWSDHSAGIRTFTLITVLGSLTALLGGEQGHWLLAAGLLAVAGAMVAMMHLRGAEASDGQPELTSVFAALVMYLVGALVVGGQSGLGVATAGTTAVLLHWKKPLHRFVDRIGESEIRAVFRLVLIALVILPLLPDRTYGPFDVLNPYRVGWMVVLPVGIGDHYKLASCGGNSGANG